MTNYAYSRNKLNGNVMDMQRASTKARAPFAAYPQKLGNDNQLWEILPNPAGYSFFRSKLMGYVIDIVEASTNPRALPDAYQQNSTGNDNQLWKVIADVESSYSLIHSKLNGNIIQRLSICFLVTLSLA